MNTSKSFVFVYGTLRQGESNHYLLKNSRRVYQQARIRGSLYDTGKGYPAFVLEGHDYVYGEIYEITKETLAALDVLEGFRQGKELNLYDRAEMEVETEGSPVKTWVYILNESHKETLKERVPFQDWKVDRWSKSLNEVKYFAYGSCMDTERITKAGMLDHFSKNVETGKVMNYSFAYSIPRPDGARANIIETTDDDYVEGIVYTLSKEAVDYLFKREGVYSNNYRPTFVDVEINGKIHENVLTFTVINKQPCSAPPEHYATEIMRGAKGRLSDEYYRKLEEKLEAVGFQFSENKGEVL
ncbi:gamma-glutamylcyclotransferase [Salipaludibacillus sp. CUR1]|uniref:gamma-glutamylcyclotransferase n=1 Tax=Salipaludibacillus sp. CUR1 TaxID=2820003 RepID=UPI001E47D3CA|nr:gamma-glutamylcyclotransferase family protein [Salipaludibacillus sp. CUR1]MCE7791992.1 gamma-glutamylcyclotransferase [Salipaludibacillus sp. CUR1]